jgi:signal transduction histidine kinase/DNA-binding response OmpR family regulator/ligand-binding sensor domain-containing protein
MPTFDSVRVFFLSCIGWVLIILLSVINSIQAQELTLSQQVIPQKIASGWTYLIYEDQFGFIWHSAGDLYKYDGKRSKRYRAILNDSTKISLGRLQLYGVLEEPNGNLFFASEKGLFYYNRAEDQIAPLLREEFIAQIGEIPMLQSLYKDRLGRLWLGGTRQVFVIEDWQSKKLRKVRDFKYIPFVRGFTRGFCEGENGQIYVATVEGLIKIEKDFSTQLLRPEGYLETEREFMFSSIQKGNKDTLWLGGTDGVWIYETEEEKFTPINLNSIKGEYVRTILLDQEERLWFATFDKLMVRYRNGKFREIASGKTALLTGINTIFQDRFGNIWTGGINGFAILDVPLDDMLPFYRNEGDHPNPDNFFFRMMQDSSEGFWFRMLNSGLAYCPYLGGPLKIVLQPTSKSSSDEIKDIHSDPDGNVWVSTRTHGLYFSEGGQSTLMPIDLGDSIDFKLGGIIFDKHDDRIAWIPSKFGLCRMDRLTLQRKWYYPNEDLPELDIFVVSVSYQSDDGTIWCSLITAEDETIFTYFDKVSRRFKLPKNAQGIPEIYRIRHILQVNENEVWATSTSGLIVANIQDKSYSILGTENGLPAKIPKSIALDRQKNIWISFSSKLCKYNNGTFECYRFHPSIGSFVYKSAILNKDGLLVFGGSKGLHVFDPEKPKRDSLVPKVYLTRFKTFNKEKDLGMAPELVKNIELDYNEKVFTFEFSAPHFVGTNKINYKYKLENFVDEWTESGNEQQVTYTNLDPGKYRFKVIASSWNGLWSNEEQGLKINLTILPPWYRTWWAYSSYVLIIGGFLFWIYQFQLNRKLVEAEANRQKELHQTKSRLFTNITHEFRTPLTIILGMADQMKTDPQNWFNEGLHLIRRNGKQLLHLVNQLLDLSKLESGHMELKLIKGDVIGFLQYLTESFHSYAESKDIRLHFSSDMKILEMDYDAEKLQNAFSNLVSNAIKFTQAGGDVYIQLSLAKGSTESNGNQLLLIVKDNGPGIPKENLPHVFDRFYQVDATTTRRGEGTGIGLALTKELVQLMGGEIKVESELEWGTKFTILLPIAKSINDIEPASHLPASPVSKKMEVEEKQYFSDVPQEDLPLILLIEDNADVITYLSSFLANEYAIITAPNGKLGVEKAIQVTPDLVVSDVMMPEMDGFEVCEILKNDERTSHIPIILLTAKSDTKAKLEGLGQGADAFLVKPFNREELLIRIEKLIELRRSLQEHYKHADELLKVTQKTKPSTDEIFLQKLISFVEENYSDELFGSAELCRKVGLSRSQLFRKLKAITGRSITNFIRSIRLAKGKELLASTDLTVSEVAFQSGFNSLNYFSKMFKEEFGLTPNEIRKLDK